MRYRDFGRSDFKVSEIGFGCGPTAALMVCGDAVVRRRAVEHALDLGINYFDTAASYGKGQSERNLGQAFAELSASAIIASKVTLEWAHLDDIPGAVEASISASIERLGVERLDIVHLHNRIGRARAAHSSFGSGALLTAEDVLGSRGVVETFRRMQASGRIGVGGCCAFGGESNAVQQVVDSGAFSSVIVNYSILNATAWRSPPPAPIEDYAAIGARAARRGMAVVGLRILEGGVLAGSGNVDPAAEKAPGRRAHLERAKSLESICGDETDSVQLAIRFAITNPELSTALVGFSDEHQIDQAVSFAKRGPLPSATLAKIEDLRARDFGRGTA